MSAKRHAPAPASRAYVGTWILTLALTAAAVIWITDGEAWVRRTWYGVPPIPAASRTEPRFLAVLFPRISPDERRYAMSARELQALLQRLKGEGYVSIGLADVEALYEKKRLLPPKAVLYVFGDSDPRSLGLADDAIKAARVRAAAFIRGDRSDPRTSLSSHAIAQMRKGGAWEFGWISEAEPPHSREMGDVRFVLDDDGLRPLPKDAARFPYRFTASESGDNEARDGARGLRILALHPDRTPEEKHRIIESAWPRESAYADDFEGDGLGADWVAAWGVVRAGGRRLELLPTPRQTGAAVFLRGTERWTDSSVEFVLRRYQKEFWVYARYREDGSFVRVGVRNGSWYVEQKVGSMSLPSMLARAPLAEDSLPARARLVVKGNTLILHVNGRMMFGRALRVHPRLVRGGLLMAVYDARPKSAMAVLSSVKAEPIPEQWVAFTKGGLHAAAEGAGLEGLREASIYAGALSPRWLSILSDGGVSSDLEEQALVRSMAGFFNCRLVPMAEFPGAGTAFLASPARSARLAEELTGQVKAVNAVGLNLRLRGADAERPETLRFLKKLRASLRAADRELWVTLDRSHEPGSALRGAVDGVWTAATAGKDFEILRPAGAGTPARAQWETASK